MLTHTSKSSCLVLLLVFFFYFWLKNSFFQKWAEKLCKPVYFAISGNMFQGERGAQWTKIWKKVQFREGLKGQIFLKLFKRRCLISGSERAWGASSEEFFSKVLILGFRSPIYYWTIFPFFSPLWWEEITAELLFCYYYKW